MRKFIGLTAVALTMTWAGSVHAQVITFGPIVGQITNSNVDYRNANSPVAAPLPYQTGPTTPPSPYTLGLNNMLTNLFPSQTRISNTIVGGQSTFPTPAQMTAAAPTYFKAFQLYRPQRISP